MSPPASSPSRPRARSTSAAPAEPAWWQPALGAILVAAVAVIVYHGILPYFFAQDDFEGLARARGLIPRLDGLWRLIGNQYYYDVMARIGGLDPFAYRVASLTLHALVSVLILFALRPYATTPAAAIGALFFAAHPALYTTLYWIAAVSAILSLAFALGVVLLERRDGPIRWLAVPLFAGSLLSKETAIGLPLVIAAGRLTSRRGLRDPVLAALALLSLVFGVAVAATDVSGLGARQATDAPYHVSFGIHVFANLMTYLGWCLNSWYVTMRGFTDVVEPQAIAAGVAALLLCGLGLVAPELRRRGWWLAAPWFLALIAPVLLLPNHTYHYYLYGPLVGLSIAIAVGADAILERLRARAAWTAAAATGLATALLAANGALTVRKIETAPFVDVLRSDPSVDRAIIARNVWRDLRAAILPPGTRLRFWSPTAAQLESRVHPDQDPRLETYWERNVRAALLDGLGVRVLFPEIREVSFARSLDAADSALYAIYRIDGSLAVATPAYLDSLIQAHGGLPGS